jgi:hypothetical protein
VNEWKDRLMNGQMDRQTEGLVNEWKDRLMNGQMDRQTEGLVNEWKRQTDEWTDGQTDTASRSKHLYSRQINSKGYEHFHFRI